MSDDGGPELAMAQVHEFVTNEIAKEAARLKDLGVRALPLKVTRVRSLVDEEGAVTHALDVDSGVDFGVVSELLVGSPQPLGKSRQFLMLVLFTEAGAGAKMPYLLPCVLPRSAKQLYSYRFINKNGNSVDMKVDVNGGEKQEEDRGEEEEEEKDTNAQ